MSLHKHVQTWCPLKSEDSSGSLHLELQMVVNHLLGSGYLTPVLCKNKQHFHHWATSVVWFVFVFCSFWCAFIAFTQFSFLICLFSCVQFIRMNLNFVFSKIQRNLKGIFLTLCKGFCYKTCRFVGCRWSVLPWWVTWLLLFFIFHLYFCFVWESSQSCLCLNLISFEDWCKKKKLTYLKVQ